MTDPPNFPKVVLGLFDLGRHTLEDIHRGLRQVDIPDERIEVVSALPLPKAPPSKPLPVGLIWAAVLGGIVGIGVGCLLAGGTSALYPLVTGGKPIVAPAIVGLVSYETMMLGAIVTAFVVLLLRLMLDRPVPIPRDRRIDEGFVGVAVYLSDQDGEGHHVARWLREAGAIDVIHNEAPISCYSDSPPAEASSSSR